MWEMSNKIVVCASYSQESQRGFLKEVLRELCPYNEQCDQCKWFMEPKNKVCS